MKQERMKILELLDQGKITATEAASLLEALKAGETKEHFWNEDTSSCFQEKVSKFSQNVEGISKDVGDKLEAVFKEIEPKLRSTTKAVVEKTAVIVDEISKSLNETLKNFEQKHSEECCDKNDPAQNKPESSECCCEEENTDADNKPIEN